MQARKIVGELNAHDGAYPISGIVVHRPVQVSEVPLTQQHSTEHSRQRRDPMTRWLVSFIILEPVTGSLGAGKMPWAPFGNYLRTLVLLHTSGGEEAKGNGSGSRPLDSSNYGSTCGHGSDLAFRPVAGSQSEHLVLGGAVVLHRRSSRDRYTAVWGGERKRARGRGGEGGGERPSPPYTSSSLYREGL